MLVYSNMRDFNSAKSVGRYIIYHSTKRRDIAQ